MIPVSWPQPSRAERASFDEASLPSTGDWLPSVTTSLTRIASHHLTRKQPATLGASFRVPSSAFHLSSFLAFAFPCACCSRDPPLSVPIFPNYPFQKGKDPCSLIPAPCSLPLLQVPRTPYCPVRPQEAALPAALDQLAALSRPPTSHLAFYERPRPRAATFDQRILRRTIEGDEKKGLRFYPRSPQQVPRHAPRSSTVSGPSLHLPNSIVAPGQEPVGAGKMVPLLRRTPSS